MNQEQGMEGGIGATLPKIVHKEIIILRVIVLSIVFSIKRWNENQDSKEIHIWQNCPTPTPIIMSHILFVVFITPSLEVRTWMFL